MRKHRKLRIALACLAVVAGVVVFATRDTEPHYQGRSLSQWLMIYYESDRLNRDPAQRPVAAAAIRAVGTNALPQLIKWTCYEVPTWHAYITRALPRSTALRSANSRPTRTTVYRGFHRAHAAQLGFRLLGTNAVSAIPELTTISQDTSRPQAAARAQQVLQSLTNAPAK